MRAGMSDRVRKYLKSPEARQELRKVVVMGDGTSKSGKMSATGNTVKLDGTVFKIKKESQR